MMIKEMRQLKQEGTFLIVDPHYLHEEGFAVTINLNDVCKVKIGREGMDIKHLLTTVKYDGTFADLTGFQVPRTPECWVTLVNEFIEQLANPATALYDDSRGTTGPLAKQRIEEAETLHKEYVKMAETLSVATDRNPNPQICDDNSVDTEACSNPKNKALLQNRPDAEPMVQHIIDLFKKWEFNHVNYQRMTSVKHPPVSTGERVPPHDDADFSADSECESYHGDSEENRTKERHIFTDNEKAAFEAAYL